MDEPVYVKNIKLRLNETSLNKDISFESEPNQYREFSRSKPIMIESEFYVKHQPNDSMEFIILNQIILELAPLSADKKQLRQVKFSILPYLKPDEKLLELQPISNRKLQKLQDPITYNVEPMPHKIKFRFETDENKEQALIGDSYNVKVGFEPEQIVLKSLKIQIMSVNSETLIEDKRSNNLAMKSSMVDVSLSTGMDSVNNSNMKTM
mmetsp:Transcript_24718/g.17412  ORF Transcript_24718/g.17412 Transcript_24718/m.17412 type:complete len:208 (-) Transcript_24718:1611-2234(-)|eukprot:CAMPEP_0116887566 /NCGR_PEP_ID=MMETSP0463-20121206/22129_1 /TAXON_ID=181622 /ORGANISM="Strombidinopsis sp, Strain SopsisLIS2011" /LENGTH=207 /DNA_ID=CAMNT_0004550541 /DNA_START=1901 /DNA_END=2524 /DNA_ORIENTATION=-